MTNAGDILDVVRGQSDWFKSLPKGATTRITPDLAEDISAVLDIAVNEIERLRVLVDRRRGMSEDIVARLRAVLNHDRAVELISREAADEIERLRRELWVLRRECDSQ